MSFSHKIFLSMFMFLCMNVVVFAENASADEEADAEETQAPTFERYQTIVERAPFGVPPPDFNPQAIPGSPASIGNGGEGGGMTPAEISAEAQRLISEVQVSVLAVTPAGLTMVGFTDRANHKNYYLKVGADKDGWKVVSADPSAQSVVLSKDGVEATVQVGASSSSGKGAGKLPLANNSHLPAKINNVSTPQSSVLAASTGEHGLRPGHGHGRSLFGGGGAMSRLREKRKLEREAKMEADRVRREKEESDKKQNQQMREELMSMKEKAEQDAIEREQNRAQLEALSEMLKRNREKQQSGEGEGQGTTGDGE
jgi:hypothetical protein